MIDRLGVYEFVGAVFMDVELFDMYAKVEHFFWLNVLGDVLVMCVPL